jgi:multidrug efflux pump subunit AcrA (membrane-fusion protein)
LKKVFITLIVLGLLGFLGLEIYQKVTARGKGPGRRGGHAAVAVEIKPVQTGTIKDMGRFTGTLYPRAQFMVAPKIGGRLEKMFVDVGDPVKADQLVAVLDEGEYVQQVEQARAELEVAKANQEESRSALDIAKRELERVRALRKKKIASESELDEAEALFNAQTAKHKVAKAQVAQKQAALKAAEVRLSYTQICVACERRNKEP